MISVNILASENTLFSTVFGPHDMLIQAGIFWNLIHSKPLNPYFDVCITSVDGKEISGYNNARLIPHRKISLQDEFDLVIIPSEGMGIKTDSSLFQQRVDYIKHLHGKGSVIASICTGAFLVAATGLLNGKAATTHWALETKFKQLFPEILLNTDLIIAQTHNIITAGGVSADQDLCMNLIEKFCGREVALQTARCTLVNMTPRKQIEFKSFIVNKYHGDSDVLKCQEYISNSLDTDITVSLLSDLVHMGTRTLNRRFKSATNFGINEYVQQLRVERAKSILERGNISFDHIAHDLGYENVSFFRRLFKKHVGLSPKEYRKMFTGIN